MTETCPICGTEGPCGYDEQGRPLVHSDAWEER